MKKRIILYSMLSFCALVCFILLSNPLRIGAATATGTCSVCGAVSSGTYDILYTNANQNMHRAYHTYDLICHSNFLHRDHVSYYVDENHTVVNNTCIYCGYDVRR